VDDRALNRRVWNRFLHLLCERSSPLRILELGGGVGATVQRIGQALADRGREAVEYTFVDMESQNVAAARERLSSWKEEWQRDMSFSIDYVTADLFDFAASDDGPYDAVVAQAVFDLLPVAEALQSIRPLLADGGLWYLPIHFDGVTAFEPPVDADLDARIERLYHESMAAGDRKEGAHTGRRLLTHLQEKGTLLAAGSSDWVVFAGEEGYVDEEAYFLHHILHFVEDELSGHPDLDSDAFKHWIEERRRQIKAGDLIYIAHQLDVLGRQPGGRS